MPSCPACMPPYMGTVLRITAYSTSTISGVDTKEHKAYLRADGEGHDDGANGQKRRAHGKADEHVHARLHLVGIACKARDERIGAHGAVLAAAEGHHARKQPAAQASSKALRAHGGEILAGKRAAKAHRAKPQHGKARG